MRCRLALDARNSQLPLLREWRYVRRVQLDLVPHPATPPSQALKVWAKVDYAGAFGVTATANIWFGVGAPASRFVIPPADEGERRDELWRTTCFEAFLRGRG